MNDFHTAKSAWVVGGSVKTSAHGLAAFKHANDIGTIRKKKEYKTRNEQESIY